MQQREQNDQDHRTGGYGGSTGGEDPTESPTPGGSSGATGRDEGITDGVDSDEALGNRTGGYGGNPSTVNDETEGTEQRSK